MSAIRALLLGLSGVGAVLLVLAIAVVWRRVQLWRSDRMLAVRPCAAAPVVLRLPTERRQYRSRADADLHPPRADDVQVLSQPASDPPASVKAPATNRSRS